MLSDQHRKDLAEFIGSSVLPATGRTYERQWQQWKDFLLSDTEVRDPLLRGTTEPDKSALVSLFLLQRYRTGLRDKGATSVTAGLRMYFSRNLQPTEFLDATVISTARSSCRRKPAELRRIRDTQPTDTVKLPACHGMLTSMRSRLWNHQPWTGPGLISRMTYLGCMWGFDQSARVSEYTVPEPRAQDHCIRLDDLSFYTLNADGISSCVGSALATILQGTSEDSPAI